MELETVLDLLGWSALPLWVRGLSVAYAASIIAYGNFGTVRDACRAVAAALRGVARAGAALAVWWRTPGKRAVREAEQLALLRSMASAWGVVPQAEAEGSGTPCKAHWPTLTEPSK